MSAAPARFTKIKDANGKHIITRDNQTGLEWAARYIGEYKNEYSDSEAEKACSELILGARDDWRLPTVDELLTLVDRSRYSPAIDVDAFPHVGADDFCDYWTYTPLKRYQKAHAWVVDLADGECRAGYRERFFGVIPVRGYLDPYLGVTE